MKAYLCIFQSCGYYDEAGFVPCILAFHKIEEEGGGTSHISHFYNYPLINFAVIARRLL